MMIQNAPIAGCYLTTLNCDVTSTLFFSMAHTGQYVSSESFNGLAQVRLLGVRGMQREVEGRFARRTWDDDRAVRLWRER